MMHGMKKSDEAVLPVKAANKGARATAELPEGRASTKGNSGGQSTRRDAVPGKCDTGDGPDTASGREEPEGASHCAIPPPDAGSAGSRLLGTEPGGGAGGGRDEVGKVRGGVGRAAARPAPPRANGGVPGAAGSAGEHPQAGRVGHDRSGSRQWEDKIVQKAVVDVVLTPIYEAEFLGFSYGFRPGRGAHDALDALAYGIEKRKVSWIVDADVRAYFDTISRDWLIRFVEHRIGDRRLIRLLRKWLNAGVMEDGTWADTGHGTPQGSVVSPVLANIYLHYVLDLWFHRKWRRTVPEGEALIVALCGRFRPRVPIQAGCGAVCTGPARADGVIRA